MEYTAGGLAVVAVGHPFDTVKVRLQTQSSINPIYCALRSHHLHLYFIPMQHCLR